MKNHNTASYRLMAYSHEDNCEYCAGTFKTLQEARIAARTFDYNGRAAEPRYILQWDDEDQCDYEFSLESMIARSEGKQLGFKALE